MHTIKRDDNGTWSVIFAAGFDRGVFEATVLFCGLTKGRACLLACWLNGGARQELSYDEEQQA